MKGRAARSLPYWRMRIQPPFIGLVLGFSVALSIIAVAQTSALRTPVLCYVETIFGDATADQLDFRPCTHVIEAFLLVDPSGSVTPVNGLPRQPVIAAARKAGAKVLVSVGGATVEGSTFATIAREPRRSERFLRELSQFVARSGYDGVDLDWEFPSPAESPLHLGLTRAVRKSLNDIMRLRDRLPPVVTVPVATYWIPGYDFADLYEVVDFAVLMGYDFRNPALGPWANSATLWPVDAREPIEGSVRGAAREIVRLGLAHDKLIIALPLYTGANQPWVDVRERVLAASAPLHAEYLEKMIDGVWVTDPEALERKIDAALTRREILGGNAAGIALWQLGHQGRHRDLTDAVVRGVRRAPTEPARP